MSETAQKATARCRMAHRGAEDSMMASSKLRAAVYRLHTEICGPDCPECDAAGLVFALATLAEREELAITLRYLQDRGWSFDEVGGALPRAAGGQGVTRERARQITMKGLRKMRHRWRRRIFCGRRYIKVSPGQSPSMQKATGPAVVDSEALFRATEQRRFEVARGCPHFALDKQDTPCLWHQSFCTHFDRPDPTITGCYAICDLVWRGTCPVYPERAVTKLLAEGKS